MQDRIDPQVVTVAQHGDRLVAVRTAHDAEGRGRMRHEATVLAGLDHPGVVRLVDHDEGPPGRLRTVFVGPDTWATRPPTGSNVCESLSTLLTTVADLHDAGTAHGDLRTEHVLIDGAGRPVLDGLAHAGVVDPHAVAADTRALVAVGRDLAGQAGDDRHQIETLLAALDAGHDDLRGTVRGLERRRLPAATPPATVDRRLIAGAGVLGAVVIVVVVAMAGGRSPAPAASSGPATPLAAPATSQPPARPPTTTSTAAPPARPPIADNAPELVHAGRRYALGQPGDVILTGDWNCDGTRTPALLRPATGEVAVFASWPSPDQPVAPSATWIVVDAIDLVATDAPCPTLRATTPNGSRLITLPES